MNETPNVLEGPYKMGTISKLTGLSPILLRAWERRYGLLRPRRGKGGQRLYTEQDLQVLQRTQHLLKDGRSIGEVAALGRSAILALDSNKAATLRPTIVAGNTEAAGFVDQQRAQIVRCAVALDSVGLHRAWDEAAAAVSVPALLERVVEPTAREIGDLWESGACTVASERLATSVFVHRIRKLLEAAETGAATTMPHVIAACLPREEHELGLLILSYFLQRAGIRVLFLGASLPLEDLRHACTQSRPAAVLLSVTRRQTFERNRAGLMAMAKAFRPATRSWIGGHGAPPRDTALELAGLGICSPHQSAQQTAELLAAEIRTPARRTR